jgi:hypothetical protein
MSRIIMKTCLVKASLSDDGKTPTLLSLVQDDDSLSVTVTAGEKQQVVRIFPLHERQQAVEFAVDYAIEQEPLLTAIAEDRRERCLADLRDADLERGEHL